MPLPSRRHRVRYRIEQHDPVRRLVIQSAVFALVVVVGWGLFQLGFRFSGFEELAAERRIEQLAERVEYLEAENRRLSDEAAYHKHSAAIEHQAQAALREALAEREAEVLSLREELAFYRSIVSPSEMRPGLHIQSIRLENGDAKGEYRYRLVLTLVRGQGRVARGEVRMVVEGVHQGKPATVEVADAGNLRFSFRYFQRLEGALKLPEGFQPQRVRVVATPSVRKLEPAEAVFAWQVDESSGDG